MKVSNNVQMITILIITLVLFHIATSEFFTALVDMEKLLHTEGEIVKTLENYVASEEKRLQKIKWLSKQYEKLHRVANVDAEKFLANPVNAYLLVKRLTTDWEATNTLINSMDSKVLIDNIPVYAMNFPNDEDLIGAATALIRLQDTYLLDTETIARGQIKGINSTYELTAGDCFELGRQAFKASDFVYTLKWMEESRKRTKKEDVETANELEILEYMAYSYYVMENFTQALHMTKQVLELDPYHQRALSNIGNYQLHADAQVAMKAARGDDFKEEELDVEIEGYPAELIEKYEKLCRGESTKSPEQESKLNCYYTTNNNHYLLLQPAKVEVLNLDPIIMVYHNVLSDAEAELIKALAKPKLARATVFNREQTDELKYASYRISKSAWLHDPEHPWIARINQRIEDMTGLDNEFAEALHVINYGIGGHYEPHFDYTQIGEKSYFKSIGNRISTWIFYLSDVAAGGSTVFPSLGVDVKPLKGSAVFWYNLLKNGGGDERTRHAGCPVLAGTKWVANKWLHQRGNELIRKCGMHFFE